MSTYCAVCVLPNTRPGLVLDDKGVCNACRQSAQEEVDWKQRKQDWEKVVFEAKEKQAVYDCVIPVSGGKDSTWQTVMCLEHGLRPLAVTWRTPARTKLGQKNLDNLISLGVDHIDWSVNPTIERTFMLETFR